MRLFFSVALCKDELQIRCCRHKRMDFAVLDGFYNETELKQLAVAIEANKLRTDKDKIAEFNTKYGGGTHREQTRSLRGQTMFSGEEEEELEIVAVELE